MAPGEEPGGEEKRNLAKYHGIYGSTDLPCFKDNNVHNCNKLPYTKTFTWHYVGYQQYFGQMTAADHEAMDGFYYAINYFNQQGTGFTFTWVEEPTGLPNDIPVVWMWEPNNTMYGSGACDVFHFRDFQGVPGAVQYANYYKGCGITLNVPRLAVLTAQWAALGYAVTPWGMGWAAANHEFGHVMGFAHSVTGGMAPQMPVSEILGADFTEPQYQALTVYNPNGSSSFTLHTIDGFTPVTSE